MTNTAVVTGANSGIGLETARALARQGYRTVLLCRNEARAAAAQADLASSVPGADLPLVLCDLGLQADVRRAAKEIDELVGAEGLALLVNNAGITIRSKEQTSEGIDMMLAVNHLGPFLLTNLLLPALERAAPARIVTVASDAHKFGRLHIDDLPCARRGYGPLGLRRYGETKMMNILCTRELARRIEGTGVTANCLHPGGVRTNIGNPPWIIDKVVGTFLKTPEAGARTSLAVATDPAYASVNGTYFAKSKPADDRLNAQAKDDALARDLWDRSAALVGLEG